MRPVRTMTDTIDPSEPDYRRRRNAFHASGDRRAARVLRRIMDFLDAARFCDRPKCRRARRCRDPKIDCAFRNRQLLVDEVFPILAVRVAEAGRGSASAVDLETGQ